MGSILWKAWLVAGICGRLVERLFLGRTDSFTHVFTQTHTHTERTHTHTQTHAHTQIHAHTPTHPHTHKHTHTDTHTHRHTRAHTQTNIQILEASFICRSLPLVFPIRESFSRPSHRSSPPRHTSRPPLSHHAL